MNLSRFHGHDRRPSHLQCRTRTRRSRPCAQVRDAGEERGGAGPVGGGQHGGQVLSLPGFGSLGGLRNAQKHFTQTMGKILNRMNVSQKIAEIFWTFFWVLMNVRVGSWIFGRWGIQVNRTHMPLPSIPLMSGYLIIERSMNERWWLLKITCNNTNQIVIPGRV